MVSFRAVCASVYAFRSFGDASGGSSAGNSRRPSTFGNSWELYRMPAATPALEPPTIVFVFVFVFVFVLLAPRRLMASSLGRISWSTHCHAEAIDQPPFASCRRDSKLCQEQPRIRRTYESR